MYNVREITKDLYWVGGNDRRLALFENIHPIPEGVSYNSYLLMDEKTVLLDTVDWSIGREFIENINHVLDGRKLDYVIINHVEPDHVACLQEVILHHPEVKVISNEKAFLFMKQFGFDVDGREIHVKEGDVMSFGKHELTFVAAPMVHWPEAMVTFDLTNGVLFSADAFGSFKSLDGALFNDEVDFHSDNWLVPARRYYTNIVGKYGPHVQHLLGKAGGLDIKFICPLHGPVWRNDFGFILDKYDKWSSYTPEEKGVLIVYGTMYGSTEKTAELIAKRLVEKGMTNIAMYDVSSTHVSYLIAEAFKYSHIVFASVTYNLNIYPPMLNLLNDMKALNLQNRTVAVVENGSWAPKSGELIREKVSEMKRMTILDEEVLVTSALHDGNSHEMDVLADAIIESMKDKKEEK